MATSAGASGSAGFTMTETLAVTLILAAAASFAAPNYFQVVEKGRVLEAKRFLDLLKTAQEAQFIRRGNYATSDLEHLSALPEGLRPSHYSVELTPGNHATCADGGPNWGVTLRRLGDVPSRYKGASDDPYSMLYDRCADRVYYQNCLGCAQDFEDAQPTLLASLPPAASPAWNGGGPTDPIPVAPQEQPGEPMTQATTPGDLPPPQAPSPTAFPSSPTQPEKVPAKPGPLWDKPLPSGLLGSPLNWGGSKLKPPAAGSPLLEKQQHAAK